MYKIGILSQNKRIFDLQYIDFNMPQKTIFYIDPDELSKGLSLNDFEKKWNIKFVNLNSSLKSIKSPLIYYTKGILNNPLIVLL